MEPDRGGLSGGIRMFNSRGSHWCMLWLSAPHVRSISTPYCQQVAYGGFRKRGEFIVRYLTEQCKLHFQLSLKGIHEKQVETPDSEHFAALCEKGKRQRHQVLKRMVYFSYGKKNSILGTFFAFLYSTVHDKTYARFRGQRRDLTRLRKSQTQTLLGYDKRCCGFIEK